MKILTTSFALLALLGVTTTARALSVSVTHTNTATCDPLVVPQTLHELGTGGFPVDEAILATDNLSPIPACVGGAPSVLVIMTNLTVFDWDNVWYVSDPKTSILNADGLVNGEDAFKIDAIGFNTPLLAEVGGTTAGVFEAGETWEFIIDGYSNTAGLPPSFFASVGLVGGLSASDSVSSGSIIATRVSAPEPSGLALAALCAAALVLRRVRNAA